MDSAVLVIGALTFIVVAGSLVVALRRQTKPRLKVYFPDGSTEAKYQRSEETTLCLHIENVGTRPGFPNIPASNIYIYVYAPLSFELKKLAYADDVAVDTKVLKAPSGGIFRDMHYLAVGDFNLFYKEVEVISLEAKMPAQTGRFTIKVAMLSNEGDLGIKKLEISVI